MAESADAVQIPLTEEDRLRPLTPIRFLDELGPVNKGASGALMVSAANGKSYLIKGPTLAPLPHVIANELISAGLARRCGLPVLDCVVVEMRGELYFGSTLLDRASFSDQIDSALFFSCTNPDIAYGMIPFDVWILNDDRHEGNLLAVTEPATGLRSLFLNDHSHLLMREQRQAADLAGYIDAPMSPYIRLDYLKPWLSDIGALSHGIDAIEQLSENAVREALFAVPEQCLSPSERTLVEEFLLRRRTRLRQIIQDGLSIFAHLQGGTL